MAGKDHNDCVDAAELAQAKPTSAVLTPPSWRASLWAWLEQAGKRVGIPNLVIGLVALGLSSVSLYYVVANYRLTVSGNRPDLASNGFKVELSPRPPHIVVNIENVGKKIARRGVARLLSLSRADGAAAEVGSAPIIGAGTNVFAGYGSTARFDLPSIEAAAFFLVCAVYFDDSGARYEQAFLFQRSGATDLAYEELAPPDLRMCSGR
jgi:hypothetical protein